MALSWNFIGGYARYPSFATAAFFGFGAYAGAIAQTRGLAMPGAWLFAGVLTAIFAAALGFVILRLRGHYFAVGSLAIVEILRLGASSWHGLTGGYWITTFVPSKSKRNRTSVNPVWRMAWRSLVLSAA